MGYKAEKKRSQTRRAVHIALGCTFGVFISLFLAYTFGFLGRQVPVVMVNMKEKPMPLKLGLSSARRGLINPSEGNQPRIAWAIPVGGKYERLQLLERLLKQLISSSVQPQDIYVFEDNESRKSLLSGGASLRLKQTAAKYGVNIIQSGVVRSRKERRNEFGLFLARHYHFMFDAVLYDGESEPYISPDFGKPFGANKLSAIGRAGKRDIYDFAVLVEDDIELMDNAVAFFTHMTIAMNADPSIFCVCGHADNAFHAASFEPKLGASNKWTFPPSSAKNGFFLRRGQHFMAPGFMISRQVYNEMIRPTWLDKDGDVLQRKRWHMSNGNWDSYLDSRIGGRAECVFPSVPVIAHRGAMGYTVRPDRQDAVFSSLGLSKLPSNTDYREAAKSVILDNYKRAIRVFIDSAEHYSCPDDIMNVRGKNVVVHIDAVENADRAWVSIMDFFGIIGLGGHFGAKARGLHEGTVFLNWLDNVVLVVAKYSPYASRLNVRPCQLRNIPAIPSLSAIRKDKGEIFIAGKPGQSCSDACASRNGGGLVCDDKRLGLLIHCGNTGICGATFHEWSAVLECDKKTFSALNAGPSKNAAPGRDKDGRCKETIGRHLTCSGRSDGMTRACVCVNRDAIDS